MSRKIVALPGDGIGKTVLPEAIRVLNAAGFKADYIYADIGWEFWCKEGNALPERTIKLLEEHKIGLFGAITSKPNDAALKELDPKLANAARELFRDYPNVEIRQGDWHDALANGPPADLLFMDATVRQDLGSRDWERMTELVKVGGQFVMDDLTPIELWPPEWQGHVDFKREFAFSNPRVIGVEVRTTATTAALIVTRIR